MNIKNIYKNELLALEKANRLRDRKIYSKEILDFASNDYLGFSEDKKLFKKAYKKLISGDYYSPKASLLVNGYSQIHKEFEDNLAKMNIFESAITVGSGFLANIAMIEALLRRGDILLIDSQYHASGILATKLTQARVIYFNHNDSNHLRELLISNKLEANRIFIAIEGIYSMGGDLANRDIFDIANEFEAILIVDEAHSSGVIGDNLLGIFDYYSIKPKSNHIKMGTLGKAYGSYGAYILASGEIINFLQNRAKPIIYSTALSLFDVALANESLNKIVLKREKLRDKIFKRQNLAREILNIDIKGLILKIEISNNRRVLEIQNKLLKENFLIGAIRQPTVKSAILRVILRVSNSIKTTKKLLEMIKESLISYNASEGLLK